MKAILVRFTSLVTLSIGGFGFASAYFTDFESGVGSEWSHSTSESFNNTTVLGEFANNSVSLTLTGLNVGDLMTIGFDLYIRDSWDGNLVGPGPDRFRLLSGSEVLMDTTFSNVNGYPQAFPGTYGVGNFPFMTNADDKDQAHGGTLPYGFHGNSLYRFGGPLNAGFTTAVTSSTMVIGFEGSNLQGVSDEGWDLDNVRVNTVPELSSLAALAAGWAVSLKSRRRA